MNAYNWRLFVFLSILTVPFTLAQEPTVREIAGEIRSGSTTYFHGLVVELDTLSSPFDSMRADVQTDGAFRFRNVPAGQYRLRVTNYSGDSIQQDFITVSSQMPPLIVQLRQRDDARPPSGSISIGRLSHPPSQKAIKRFMEAQKLSAEGKYDRAIQKLNEAVTFSPEFSEAWTNLAVQHIRLQLYDHAVREATHALEIAGPNAVDFCNLAVAQWGAHQYPEALQSALKATNVDPSSVKAHYLAGAMLANANQWTEARPHLERAAATMSAARQILDQAPSQSRRAFLPR